MLVVQDVIFDQSAMLSISNIALKIFKANLFQYSERTYYRPIFEVKEIGLSPYMVSTGNSLSLIKCLLNMKLYSIYKLKKIFKREDNS